jgi:hypothetical protein
MAIRPRHATFVSDVSDAAPPAGAHITSTTERRTRFMKRETKGLTSISATLPGSADPTLQRRIAERAYQLFELRGHSHGSDVDDWLRAEREIRAAWRPTRAAGTKRTTNGRSRPRTRNAA